MAEKKIILRPLYHRGQECIALLHDNDSSLNEVVKKLTGIKWSRTHRCWYIPLSRESYNQIRIQLREKSQLDTSPLKEYLEKKKKMTATLPLASKKSRGKPVVATAAWKLGEENLRALEKFVEQLKLKSYRSSTIRTYRNEFLQLLQLLKNKPVNQLTPDDLKRYMVYAMENQRINENTAHSRLNALKFYFEQVIHHERFF